MEIDNHADTTVLGDKCLVIHDFNRPVDVNGYDPTSGSQECATITGATAYNQPVTRYTYMLVWNQAMHFNNLTNHLLCPMRSIIQGVKINELPNFLFTDPDYETHAILDKDALDSDENLIIPLSLNLGTSYFPVRRPITE